MVSGRSQGFHTTEAAQRTCVNHPKTLYYHGLKILTTNGATDVTAPSKPMSKCLGRGGGMWEGGRKGGRGRGGELFVWGSFSSFFLFFSFFSFNLSFFVFFHLVSSMVEFFCRPLLISILFFFLLDTCY